MMKRISLLFVGAIAMSCWACHKEFLDVKRDKRNVIPIAIADFEAILDNPIKMNYQSSHGLAFMSSDEYHVQEPQWAFVTSAEEQNAYTWHPDLFEGGESLDWNRGYERVLYANLVLAGIVGVSPSITEQERWDVVHGAALFHRSLAFYELAQLFCDTYREEDAAKKPGIPLRLESDIEQRTPRSTIKATYERIVGDLEKALDLLPHKAIIKERPTKQAALLLLARVHLQMGKYPQALTYSREAISAGGHLVDYNFVDAKASFPFSFRGVENPEVVFFSRLQPPRILASSQTFNIAPHFFAMFDENDLRKDIFFNQELNLFKGSYFGGGTFFTGLALDEAYLINAECEVRSSNFGTALSAMTDFQQKRYKVPPRITAETEEDWLDLIYEERKKQLYCRGVYWSDLKRLNYDPRFQVTLTRTHNGKVYELAPLDSKYILPIPDSAVKLGGVQQNPRQ